MDFAIFRHQIALHTLSMRIPSYAVYLMKPPVLQMPHMTYTLMLKTLSPVIITFWVHIEPLSFNYDQYIKHWFIISQYFSILYAKFSYARHWVFDGADLNRHQSILLLKLYAYFIIFYQTGSRNWTTINYLVGLLSLSTYSCRSGGHISEPI